MRTSASFPFATLVALVVLSLFVNQAQAYPEMIRHKYTQCQACHTNSSGAGLLNLYGKSIRANLALFRRLNEQKNLEEASGQTLNANFYARYLWIESESYQTRFLMQSDASVRYQNELKPKLPAVQATFGLVPTRIRKQGDAPDGVLGKSFILRQFYGPILKKKTYSKLFTITKIVKEDLVKYQNN